MKNILITGKHSYLGLSLQKFLQNYNDEYEVETISLRDKSWYNLDFSHFDVVFHVAGIAHVDVKKGSVETEKMYYKINRDLAIEVAKKAKKDGVGQFIFMSSMIVYGDSSVIGGSKVITKNTIPTPTSYYGDSKLQAEKGICKQADAKFKVSIIRAPMLYGIGCKGNYATLSKYARILPIFPDIKNERSMLYVGNLMIFLKGIIDQTKAGFFFPQNKDYVCTSNMVKMVSFCNGKNIILLTFFNPILKKISKYFILLRKIFGDLVYQKELSKIDGLEYQSIDFEKSINETEEIV